MILTYRFLTENVQSKYIATAVMHDVGECVAQMDTLIEILQISRDQILLLDLIDDAMLRVPMKKHQKKRLRQIKNIIARSLTEMIKEF